jgi:hypothetical protein
MSNVTININGGDHFIQTGENAKGVKKTFNNGEKELDLEAVLKALEDAFKQEPAEAMPETVACDFNQPMSVLGDIRTVAYEAEEKQVEPEQAKTVLERFTQMVATSGPKIRKALLAFATTTASAYLGENPIVQGVLAAINAVQES